MASVACFGNELWSGAANLGAAGCIEHLSGAIFGKGHRADLVKYCEGPKNYKASWSHIPNGKARLSCTSHIPVNDIGTDLGLETNSGSSRFLWEPRPCLQSEADVHLGPHLLETYTTPAHTPPNQKEAQLSSDNPCFFCVHGWGLLYYTILYHTILY